MKPLNSAERSNAFWRFLLFFLITIALVIVVIFFSIDVPYQESKRLRERLVNLQNEKDVSDSFSVVMNEAVAEINNFDTKSQPTQATFRKVQEKIIIMNSLLRNFPNGNNSVYGLSIKSVYELSIQNLDDLNKAKLKLSSLSNE